MITPSLDHNYNTIGNTSSKIVVPKPDIAVV